MMFCKLEKKSWWGKKVVAEVELKLVLQTLLLLRITGTGTESLQQQSKQLFPPKFQEIRGSF